MSSRLESHIIFRLILSKSLLRDALSKVNDSKNEFEFSIGIIILHDAVDNFLGALASHLSVDIPQKAYLMDLLILVEKKIREQEPQFFYAGKDEINSLNNLRNQIKHHGIIPNVNQARSFVQPVVRAIHDYCQKYFYVSFDAISLSLLVDDTRTREELFSIEEEIESGNVKEALNRLALLKFKYFDENLVKIRLSGKYDIFSHPTEATVQLRSSENLFLDRSYIEELNHRIKFLEKGIDYRQMEIFERLTARVGINNVREWKYIYRHSPDWASPSWTQANAYLCLGILVDAIVSHQSSRSTSSSKMVWTKHRIRALEDVILYDKDDVEKFIFKKNTERLASVSDYVDGAWEDFNSDDLFILLHTEGDQEDVHGYIKKDDKQFLLFIKSEHYILDADGSLISV